jgi:hypothetical protein
MCARYDAGTLFAPLTPLERRAMMSTEEAQERNSGGLPLPRAGCLIIAAIDAARTWPPLSDNAAEEARLRGVASALRAVLTVYQHHGGLREGQRGLVLTGNFFVIALPLLLSVLDDATSSARLLHSLRATCGLSHEEEATLRREVLPGVMQMAMASGDALLAMIEMRDRRAAADLARHGLRACALPGCGATEPQPKVFKVCSRCRRTCYCSQAHQAQDWRRHKREDACAAAPQ